MVTRLGRNSVIAEVQSDFPRTADEDDKPLLSVIVPTRNEAGNIAPLVRRIEALDASLEVVFVDDSDDGTEEAINAAAQTAGIRVQALHRQPGNRGGGLGSAVVEGLRLARGQWACVMDGDLQHPPELIPEMLAKATSGYDLVLASRYMGSGDRSGLNKAREGISRLFISMARVLFPRRLKGVSDPLTGFFVVRLGALDLAALRPNGFKILLEILVRTPNLRVGQVPFHFGPRLSGESKASAREGMRYVSMLWKLRFGSLTARVLRFSVVGISGLFVNVALLAAFTEVGGFYYLASVVLATQGSSLWNFGLTEAWVFSDRRQSRGTLQRMLAFVAMNNTALLLRGPVIFMLVSGFGLHYLIANLLSLGALTLIRFFTADNLIWRRRATEPVELPHLYDVHGIVSVGSAVALPELERFRVPELAQPPTISVHVNRAATVVSSEAGRSVHYTEVLGPFGFAMDICIGERIEIRASRLLKRSSHVLYTNVVEPILRWTFVERGYALVHGACVAFEDDAYLITARTDTGKTTTILRTLDNMTCDFLSDDLTLISPDGKVLPYPKPLTISRHTLHAVKTPLLNPIERMMLFYQSRIHSRSGRLFAKIVARTHLPAATINALVQFLIPPPKYDVARLVPGVHVAQGATLAGMIVIEKGSDGQLSLAEPEALDTLMLNCEDAYGFPPYHDIESFLHSSNGRDLKALERSIVARALSGLPTTLLSSSTMDWWKRVPALLESAVIPVHLRAVLPVGAEAGVVVPSPVVATRDESKISSDAERGI
ncbi:MAG: glycosyltransferase [Dehalococcoidia bacterium]|nr:glycosyltransferase [Dehalococcoidia bacterium]